MKVLFVTSEAAPYAASGGLGDVMGALPPAISESSPDSEVAVILPYYDTVRAVYGDKLEKVCDVSFKLSWRSTGASVYRIKNGNVDYFFVENHYYFDRGRLYGEWDDGERFAFFSMAVIEFILKTGNIPDIIHANDWQTALTVIYLKTLYRKNPKLMSIRTLYTVHNIEYQGKYDTAILGDIFALDKKFLDVLEYDGCINLMKGALSVSDYVSTVSPNYANELKHDFFAFGLAPVISAISSKMRGVINGIDYNYFSPKLGSDIYFPYDKRTVKSGKAKNKKAFQEEVGLEVRDDVPLLVMITRLTAGKGIDLVIHILEELLCENNVQVAILGTGDKEYEDKLLDISNRHSNLVSLIKFDRVLSKKMYAAADMFLMPSKSEPCGLAQMIACSYGTIPIVRSVGGLFDSISHWDGEKGNGLRFDNYNAHELLYTVKYALSIYGSDSFNKLRKNAINSNFSWTSSAAEYIDIYNNLLKW